MKSYQNDPIRRQKQFFKNYQILCVATVTTLFLPVTYTERSRVIRLEAGLSILCHNSTMKTGESNEYLSAFFVLQHVSVSK